MSQDRFLEDKKVLFLSYEYYDYHIHIQKTLEKAGAILDVFPVMKYDFLYTFLRKLNKKLFLSYTKQHGRNILKEIRDKSYDYVFVIQGFQFSDDFYQTLKSLNPNAVFLNYHWDSVKKTVYDNTYLDKVHFFDRVYSFDREDCQAYNLNYLPLFYTETYEDLRKDQINSNEDIDLLFIGSLCQYRRYQYVKQIEKICSDQGLNFFYYLKVSKRFYLTNLFKGRRLKNVNFKSISQEQIVSYYKRAKAIIDLPNHIQSGLTMRVLEVLGAGKKLITTNKNITKEPFYTKDNILVIDLDNLSIDKSFVIKETKTLNNEIQQYSIFEWLRKIFVQ